jgi:hypothetical protein
VAFKANSYVADVLGFEGSATAETVYIACHDFSQTGSDNFKISTFLYVWGFVGFRGACFFRDETSSLIFSISP